MNYLAHAYLSFNDPEIVVGNMISDFVKGKKKFDYPIRIQAGIMLHRLIDNFTDDHPATREAKEFFRPHYRLYSGAFIDVVYDHFLATDTDEFTESSLLDFSQQVYHILEENKQWLPERFAGMLPYMKSQNWLFNYRTLLGTQRSFEGLVRRSTYLEESETAARLFEKHYQPLEQCYRHFWTEARPFIFKEYEILSSGLA
ncbi:MAG TPA: ACP phosphodiesterase [Chitinophagaceae bacterium]|nr:ACP phosphodiesterase [Chitinophagaceae bacterium]